MAKKLKKGRVIVIGDNDKTRPELIGLITKIKKMSDDGSSFIIDSDELEKFNETIGKNLKMFTDRKGLIHIPINSLAWRPADKKEKELRLEINKTFGSNFAHLSFKNQIKDYMIDDMIHIAALKVTLEQMIEENRIKEPRGNVNTVVRKVMTKYMLDNEFKSCSLIEIPRKYVDELVKELSTVAQLRFYTLLKEWSDRVKTGELIVY